MLFQQVPKIILLSAILTPHIVENLGIDKPQWIEAESPFPASNTPITHINTMRVDHRATDEMMMTWVRRIDDIIRGRQDKKGLVFTVSYARAKLLRENSRYKEQIFIHDTKNVREVVEKFKAAPAPAVLVSPSVTTGWDFPQEECEYIVVGKVPYPDTRGALIQARMADNRDWAAQLAMETLVQETGRGTRSADDKCQVLVVDDAWRWWWPKYKHFAPTWFQERVSRHSTDLIPQMS
jgi:Rad3-related DNA helicase